MTPAAFEVLPAAAAVDGRPLPPRPLRTHFVLTSMEVGGAETLLLNLIERCDRRRIDPRLVCLKGLGELGERLATQIPTRHGLLSSKFDPRVLPRFIHLLRRDRADAVVTVGAGDKMFWGRIAGRIARVPAVASALHSTGWPDGISRLNRMLTPWTDAFIAVADAHGRFLREKAGLPADRVVVIPNGIDTQRFRPDAAARAAVREQLKIAKNAAVIAIVAALRPEKDHELFLSTAAKILSARPDSRFLIIGEGPQRPAIEAAIGELGLTDAVLMLGNRHDAQRYLAASDLFMLTSLNEAKPVSILEALACGVPVVAPEVGSVPESVRDGQTGFLARTRKPGDFAALALAVLNDRSSAAAMGAAGRAMVERDGSLETMVRGYEDLVYSLWSKKSRKARPQPSWLNPTPPRRPACR